MFLSLSLSFFLHQLIISCSDFCRKQTSTKSTPSPSLLVFREPCGNEMSGTTNREMDEHQPILVPRVGNATFLADKLRFSLSLCLQTNDRAFFSSVTAVLPPSSLLQNVSLLLLLFQRNSRWTTFQPIFEAREIVEAGKLHAKRKRNPPLGMFRFEIQMAILGASWRGWSNESGNLVVDSSDLIR